MGDIDMNKLSITVQKKITIFTFLVIPISLLLVFSYYPALKLVYFSFTSWDGVSLKKEFIGFSNYFRIFTTPELYTPFFHNGILFIVGLVQVVLAFYFAIILNSALRARNAFRTIIFLPYVINSVAIAFIFNFFLSIDGGALNTFLSSIGLSRLALDWLGDARVVNWVMGFMALWKYTGFMMIIFLGALQSIPQDMYEASYIDGAKSYQQLVYITLPSIRSIIALVFFLNLNGVISAFEFPFIMYPDGSPFGMADTFMVKTISTAFRFSDFGLASAMGVVLVVIVAILAVIQNKILPKED
jgi:raffinose/stachyose/melibiose transport system permease protein